MEKQLSSAGLKNINVETVAKEDLVDVDGFIFDYTIPPGQRMGWILQKVKNPYCFRMGNMAVKVEFSDNAPPLQDLLTGFLIRKKGG